MTPNQFKAAAAKTLAQFSARADPGRPDAYLVDTTAGELWIKVESSRNVDCIFMRFNDVDRANTVLPPHWQHNKFSGKSNLHAMPGAREGLVNLLQWRLNNIAIKAL